MSLMVDISGLEDFQCHRQCKFLGKLKVEIKILVVFDNELSFLPAKRPAIAEVKDLMRVEKLPEA